jgi:8-amino-3,8-dideoxy-alpha-D-manno-octulosonate transaminase
MTGKVGSKVPGYEAIGSEELAEVMRVFESGGVLFRHGFDNIRGGTYAVRDFERAFAEKFAVPRALAVTSGTAALRVALAAAGVGRGDSVLIPAFTFVATAEAVIEAGAIPVAVEVDETLTMDPDELDAACRPDTKAVIVVHMLGVPADLRRISAFCEERGLVLIEDTAWGCGASLDGRLLGTWAPMGTFSFDYAKTLTTGEGGMVTFQDENVYQRAAAWHDHGHENNPAVPRWEDTRASSGFNFRMMELQGAVGLAQLRKLDTIIESQRARHAQLREVLEVIPGVTWRSEPTGTDSSCDAAVFFTHSPQAARACRDALLTVGFGTKILPEAVTWHFAKTWSHMPELVAAHGGSLENAFPKSEALLARAVALPVTITPGAVSPDVIAVAVAGALGT